MKELVNNWNEKHPEYVLVHGMYSYVDNGQSKDMHMLTIFNKDNECVCEYKGEDFIKLYNTLEEEWYYQVEEPEFLKFYNCHLEMIK